MENQFGWSTHTFLELFNAGKIGDEQEFFRWYALAEALREWQETRGYLQEMLSNEIVRQAGQAIAPATL